MFLIGGLKREKYIGVSSTKVTLSKDICSNGCEYGFKVISIIDGSPAAVAGIMEKDIIVAVNGEKIQNEKSISEMINYKDASRTVTFEIIRDNQKLKKLIQLKIKPLEKNDNIDIIYTSFNSNNRKLRMIITKPKDSIERQAPAVLFIQGVECTSIDFPLKNNHLYKNILYLLTFAGFITIRMELSGIGDSEGVNCKDSDFYDQINDFDSALKYINSFDFIDKNNIFIFGYSMGGVIAPILAQSNKVKGIIVFGTITSNFCEYILETTKRQRKLNGENKVYIEKYLEEMNTFYELLLVRQLPPEEVFKINKGFQSYMVNNKYIFNRSYVYFQQLSKINIIDVWKTIKRPVLILAGKADYVVDINDHKVLYDVLKCENPVGIVNYLQVPVDHSFNNVESMEESFKGVNNKSFFNETVDLIVKWLLEIIIS